MTLHFLEARGDLRPDKAWMTKCLHSSFAAVCNVAEPGNVDVVVQHSTRVIPVKGHVGYCSEGGRIFLNVDPENPTFRANLAQSLERVLAHELHHSMRWDRASYGRSLGGAMVSEGLAGHFVQQVFGGAPEPWETALDCRQRQALLGQAEANWDNAEYDHAAWFFGAGDLPNWSGYCLGYRIVGQYLAQHPHDTPVTLAGAKPERFRDCLNRLS